MTKYTVKILKIEENPKGVYHYALEIPEGLEWDEGTHLHIAHVGFDREAINKEWVRHMSINSLANEGYIGFSTRIEGQLSVFKEKLIRLHVGDEMVIFKLGSRMALRREERPLLLLSMGVGIATMRPIIKQYTQDKEGVHSLISLNVNKDNAFIHFDEIEALKCDTFNAEWVDNRSDYYFKLQSLVESLNPICYIVGSDPFIKQHIVTLRGLGVKDKDIIVDKKETIRKEYYQLEA